ncbi:MAG: DUF4154 domain-containing protein [Calditrichaceae bacterium]|nr:DUF4154 domain-containing protein [Calditrichaceae bacterium]MBN2707829.1 DUF4154 domain-containing protein [Calditrichaceae bacterium]RQV94895.1 MAG: DUF4154 domain-containing protein [Calditrichota bacterium]
MMCKFKSIFLVIGILFSVNNILFAQTKEAPAPIAAALLVKVIGFEKNISAGEITIYVLGSSDITAELRKVIGTANIKSVQTGSSLPSTKPSILFIADEGKMAEAVEYTRKNKILSVTNLPELVSKGVTLGFGIGKADKPIILMNLTSSAEESLDWNPAIMKVAQTTK